MKHTNYTLAELRKMDFSEKEFIYHSILYDYEVIYGKTDKQSNRIELDEISESDLRSELKLG